MSDKTSKIIAKILQVLLLHPSPDGASLSNIPAEADHPLYPHFPKFKYFMLLSACAPPDISDGGNINTLVNKVLSSSEHSIVWNGDDQAGNPVASGIYLYRLQTPEFSEMRKMNLMK